MNPDTVFLGLAAAAFSTFAIGLLSVSIYVKLEDRQRAGAPMRASNRAGAGDAARPRPHAAARGVIQ